MMNLQDEGKHCLQLEAQALLDLIPTIGEAFEKAVNILADCSGKVVVTGVGKSGHVGSKMAATLASTGTPSFYLNPLDAYHGDLGMIGENDVLIAISYSGNTDELLRFIPLIKERGITIIGMSSNADSLLAHYSDVHLSITVSREADPLNLAPTASTTVTMALGDALASALMVKKNFQKEDFARRHPGGDLGRRLLTRVSDMMVTQNLPVVAPDEVMGNTIELITKGQLGIAIVIDRDKLVGIITDGDVRRAMHRMKDQFFTTPVADIMTREPKTILESARIVDAGEEMNHYSIHTLIVLNELEQVVGVIDSFSCLPGIRFYH